MRSGGAGAVEAVRLALEAAAERLFKSISRAHALLTDAAERRRFDTLELHHDCYHVGSKVLPHAPPTVQPVSSLLSTHRFCRLPRGKATAALTVSGGVVCTGGAEARCQLGA